MTFYCASLRDDEALRRVRERTPGGVIVEVDAASAGLYRAAGNAPGVYGKAKALEARLTPRFVNRVLAGPERPGHRRVGHRGEAAGGRVT
ncbi:hypothetical protein GCM10009552_12560 [Rothia nasimurium]